MFVADLGIKFEIMRTWLTLKTNFRKMAWATFWTYFCYVYKVVKIIISGVDLTTDVTRDVPRPINVDICINYFHTDINYFLHRVKCIEHDGILIVIRCWPFDLWPYTVLRYIWPLNHNSTHALSTRNQHVEFDIPVRNIHGDMLHLSEGTTVEWPKSGKFWRHVVFGGGVIKTTF